MGAPNNKKKFDGNDRQGGIVRYKLYELLWLYNFKKLRMDFMFLTKINYSLFQNFTQNVQTMCHSKCA
jgi:hypothetical protein